jgi:hypothetical protein
MELYTWSGGWSTGCVGAELALAGLQHGDRVCVSIMMSTLTVKQAYWQLAA